MRDEIKNRPRTNNECMVINTDHSSNEGTHWTCLYIDKVKVTISIRMDLNQL